MYLSGLWSQIQLGLMNSSTINNHSKNQNKTQICEHAIGNPYNVTASKSIVKYTQNKQNITKRVIAET